MKIAIITAEYRGFGGGIMTFYRGLAPRLVAAGHDVTVIEGSGFGLVDQASPQVIDGVHVEGVEASRAAGWAERFEHLAATPALRRVVAAGWAAWEQARARGPFDLIEATEFGLLHVPHALSPLAPTVAQCHGGWGQIGLHESEIAQAVDRALALALETEALRHVAARHTGADANARWWARQISMPVATVRPAWCPATSLHASVRKTALDPAIRVFGRIQAWKGPREAAQAWTLAADLPAIDWYGRDMTVDARGGSTDAALRAAFPGVWGVRIRPRTTVPPEEVAMLQARALLNLVPSTWDVFNFTAVEAMSSARPVVCSDRAGASELIEDGRTGFIYNGASPAALVEVVRRALSMGEAALARIGAQGREAALAALDPGRQVQEHLMAYDAALTIPLFAEGGPPAWFAELAAPREFETALTASHLDQHPLRALAAHVVKRGIRKAGFA